MGGAVVDTPEERWERQRRTFGDITVVARTCPLCGDANEATPASRYSVDPWTVKTCGGCGFTYITAAPDYAALFEQMSWEKTAQLETERREATRPVQQSLSKKTRWRMGLLPRKKIPELLGRFAEAGAVVDLGCGDGGQLEGIAPSFIPHGIEISRELAARADARFRPAGGYAVNASCLDGLREFPDEYFTAASLRSYLEHELRPAEVLRELWRTLKPGAIIIAKVPNFASLNRRVMGLHWCGFRHPDHLNYFTPQTLRRMASDCGFQTWFGLTWRFPTSDNMWALLSRPVPA
jgi:SAM-dependent methyltransferase